MQHKVPEHLRLRRGREDGAERLAILRVVARRRGHAPKMAMAEWQLEGAGGHRATFSAQRSASGAGDWIFACPQCGRPPATLVVCRHDHCACESCSHRCSVCAQDFCAEHGIAQCRVDGEPACAEHVHACPDVAGAAAFAHVIAALMSRVGRVLRGDAISTHPYLLHVRWYRARVW